MNAPGRKTLLAVLFAAVVASAAPAMASRGHSSHGHGHGHGTGHGHSHGNVFWGAGFFFGGPYRDWGCGYWPCSGPAYFGRPDYALIDTDVEPEKARVYLDGEEAGVADDFDGFPQYLAVSPGRHLVEFRSPGLRSLRITLHAQRGQFYQIDRKLRAGDPARDESDDLGSGSPGRRAPDDAEDDADDDADDDDQRTQGDRDAEQSEEPDADRAGQQKERAGRGRGAGEDGTGLILKLKPADSAVYVDGAFFSAGGALNNLRGVPIEPGRHAIEVVRPGYRSYRTTLVIEPGETRELTVRLVSESTSGPR